MNDISLIAGNQLVNVKKEKIKSLESCSNVMIGIDNLEQIHVHTDYISFIGDLSKLFIEVVNDKLIINFQDDSTIIRLVLTLVF